MFKIKDKVSIGIIIKLLKVSSTDSAELLQLRIGILKYGLDRT